MQEKSRENLIEILYEWGFKVCNIARVFDVQSSFVFELTERLTPTEQGVCIDDGWLMEELMRMGFSKREVSLLFGMNEVFIDTYIEKYHSKEIAIANK